MTTPPPKPACDEPGCVDGLITRRRFGNNPGYTEPCPRCHAEPASGADDVPEGWRDPTGRAMWPHAQAKLRELIDSAPTTQPAIEQPAAVDPLLRLEKDGYVVELNHKIGAVSFSHGEHFYATGPRNAFNVIHRSADGEPEQPVPASAVGEVLYARLHTFNGANYITAVDYDTKVAEHKAVIAGLREELAAAKANLRKYGAHHLMCNTEVERECSCGFDSSIAAVSGEGK